MILKRTATLVKQKRAIATRGEPWGGREKVILRGVALGTYNVWDVSVVAKLLLHAWPQLRIVGQSKDLVIRGAMWPKQLRFTLMMGTFGD